MKQTVVVHANCQGEMLAGLLRGHEPFAARCDCLLFTNYIREEIPPDVLARCDVFLYQHLGPKWGDLASEALLARLPADCRTLAIPNMFMRMYWPLHQTGEQGSMQELLLDDLLAKGLNRAEYQLLATRTGPLKAYNLDAIVQRSIRHERNKEGFTPIKYAEMMLEQGRKERLFYTPNHPGGKLLRFMTDAVLDWLGFPPLPTGALALDDYYTSLELPIHPGVARFFGLEFIDERSVFNVYGVPMTWAQYASVYADYQTSEITSFIEYMGRRFTGGEGESGGKAGSIAS